MPQVPSEIQANIALIDARLDHIGVSKLRQFDSKAIKESTHEKPLVIRHRDEPLAVLMGCQQYLALQNQLHSALNTIEILSNKKEMALLRTGLKQAAAGQVESLADVRRSLNNRGL